MVYKFFDKKSSSLADKSAKGSGFKSDIKQNEQLTEEMHKSIIRKFNPKKAAGAKGGRGGGGQFEPLPRGFLKSIF